MRPLHCMCWKFDTKKKKKRNKKKKKKKKVSEGGGEIASVVHIVAPRCYLSDANDTDCPSKQYYSLFLPWC